MQIHQLQPLTKQKKKKRIGRGGKRGTYCGRGIKGQKSRAGAKIKPQIREMILKFPKKRGTKFPVKKEKPVVVTLSDIKRKFPQGGTITPKKLEKAGLIHLTKHKKAPVKILHPVEIDKQYIIKKCLVSRKVQEVIVRAGGKVETK